MLRLVLFFFAGLLLSCGSSEPPPGDLIGTFAFRATLEPPAEQGCPWPDSPERLDFEGIVSWEPAAETVWLTIGGVTREGRLEGDRFEAVLPGEEAGGRAVPRKLRSCDCEMEFLERFDLRLVDDPLFSCLDQTVPITSIQGLSIESEPEGPFDRSRCPRTLDDGTIDWGGCGGLCGNMVESVKSPPGCMCTVEGVPGAAPSLCEIRYKLRATRVGGRT